jgi:hypothetical protein
MRFATPEFLFIGCGAVLGALTAYAVKAAVLTPGGALPPFVIVLLGLGLVEVGAGLALQRSPGTLIGMPARLAAFVLGVGVLTVLGGMG